MWLYILMGIAVLYVLGSLIMFYKLMRSFKNPDIPKFLGYSFGVVWILIPYLLFHVIRSYISIKWMNRKSKRRKSQIVHNYSKRYVYHSPFNGNHKPRVTVIGLLNENTGRLDVGIARCSKEDMFSRQKGRIIAEDRAKDDKRKRETIKVNEKSKEEMDDVFYRTAKTLSDVVLKDTYYI